MKINAERIVLMLICTLILVLLKPNIAFSEEISNEQGTVQIEYIFEDVRFEIRKVADIADTNEYVLCDEYKECGVSLDSDVSSDRKEQAEILKQYVYENEIAFFHATRTNEYDVAVFENIEKGIYLVTGESVDSEGFTYTPLPILVFIPDVVDSNEEIYNIIIEPKYERTEIVIPEEPETPTESTEPETPTTPNKPIPNIPHTGQRVEHIIVCGLLAVMLYSGALFFRKSKKVFFTTLTSGTLVMVIGVICIVTNINKDAKVEVKSQEIVEEIQNQIVNNEGIRVETDNEKTTESIAIEENVVTVEDNEYIGIISIPKLDKNLPVMNQLTKEKLEISPCLYYAHEDNFIIGAHNYQSLFGRISKLSEGDQVIFTDVNNNEIYYEVSGIEIINPDDRDVLVSGKWDMTLFTCTYMGKQRVVVRCNKI